MVFRICGFCAGFIAVILVGVFIGYTIKPQIEIVAYDPAACSPAPSEFWDISDHLISEFRDTNPDVASLLKQMGEIRPLVNAGPFMVLWNSNNGDYVIYDTIEKQAIVTQITRGDKTNLSFDGKDEKVCCDLNYSKNSNRLISSLYFSGDKGDDSGLPKYSYLDKDGNGQFDIMVDREAGVRYEQKGLHWEKIESLTDGSDHPTNRDPKPDNH